MPYNAEVIILGICWFAGSMIGSFAGTINLENSRNELREDAMLDENNRLRMEILYFKRHHCDERSNAAALAIQREWKEYNRYRDM